MKASRGEASLAAPALERAARRASRGEASLAAPALERAARRGRKARELAQPRRPELGVEAALTIELAAPRRDHPLAHRGRALALRLRGKALELHAPNGDLEVDPVEKWTRHAALVCVDRGGRAPAGPDAVAGPSARAWIGGGDQRETRRIRDGAARARDRDAARFERLAPGRSVVIYRCTNYGPGRGDCGRVSIRADQLEPRLVEATIQYVDRLTLGDLIGEGAPDLTAMSKELSKLDGREDDLAKSFAIGKTSRRILELTQREIEQQRTDIRKRLNIQARHNALATFAGKPGALRAAWDALSVDQRRMVIAEALHRVTIKPAKKGGWQFDPTRIVIGDLAQPRK